MYAHCLFCNADLGRNEALEAFPVGRRIAYDADKGRLWVVCGACRRWNLTPLEERWGAIEQAERLYKGTRLRAWTDNVGLARVADGADLVRIGKPLRPELAAWRYAREFQRRRRMAHVRRALGWTVTGGIVAALTSAFGPLILIQVAIDRAAGLFKEKDELPGARVFDTRVRVGGVLVHMEIAPASVRVVTGASGAPEAVIPYGRGTRTLGGADGFRILAGLLRQLNAGGAPADDVGRAVNRLARVPDLPSFLRSLERRTSSAARWQPEVDERPKETPRTGLLALGATDLLALEMVLHDDSERRALDGELADLTCAGRDAEEVAAIADGLGLPRTVEAAWDRLVGRLRPS